MKKKLRLYWLWMPVIHFLLLFFCYYAVINSIGSDLGNVVILLNLHVFFAFFVTPTTSVLYCRVIRRMDWKKYLCCIYNAVIMGLYYTINEIFIYIDNDRTIRIGWTFLSFPYLSVFIPALICGLITLITYDKKNRKAEDASLSQ